MSRDARPRCPAGLQRPGRALWREVLAAFELRSDELKVLESACRLTDDLARLTEELADAPTMISGSKGQTRPHPLFAEVRQHRLSLARLLAQLGLEDADAKRSTAGRRLARLRWSPTIAAPRDAGRSA